MADPKVDFVELQLDAGVDTYTASEKVQLPKHLALEDADLDQPGALRTRRAYSKLSKTVRAALVTDIDATRVGGLITDGDALLALVDVPGRFGLGAAWDGTRWVVSEPAGYFPVTSARSLIGMEDVAHTQCARVTGWACVYARTNAASNPHRYVITRESDDASPLVGYFTDTVSGSASAANGCQPKLVAMGDRYFFWVWVEGADLKYRAFDSQAPSSGWSGSADIVTADVHATHKNLDAWADSTRLYVGYNSVNGVKLLRCTQAAGVLSVAASSVIAATLADSGVAVAALDTGGGFVLLVQLDSATATITGWTRNESSLAAVASGTVEAGLGTVIELTAVMDATFAYIGFTLRLSTGIDSSATRIRRYQLSTAGVDGASNITYGGLFISKRPVRIRGQFVWGLHHIDENSESSEYLVVHGVADSIYSLAIVAQLNPLGSAIRAAGHFNIASRLVPADAAGDVWIMPGYESIAHIGVGDTGSRIRLVTLDGRPHIANPHFLYDRMLFVGGSYPRRWSRETAVYPAGAVPTELSRGFQAIVPPHPPTVGARSQSTGAGALTLLATYTWVYTYEYVGQDGRRAQSAPCVAESTTLTGTNNTVSHNLDLVSILPQFREPSMTRGSQREHQIVIWRTLGNAADAIYYRAGSVNAGTTTFSDTLSDAVIATNEILYTVGGELENRQAPPSLAMFPWKDRIVCLHGETGELWPSKSWDASEVGGWNIALAVQTNVWRGPPKFASPLDDKIVVWWEDAIGIVYGEPASDTGEGGTLAPPILIKKGIGLLDVASVVDTPDALLFRGQRGFYSLGRDLTVQFIGRPATGLLPATECVGALHLSEREEVRFLFADRIVSYHLARQEWCTHLLGSVASEVPTRPVIAAGVVIDDAAVLCWETEPVADRGFVWRESAGAASDPGNERPTLRASTGWLKLGGTMGPQRIERLWLTGVVPVGSALDVYYDYASTPVVADHKAFDGVGGKGSSTLTTYALHLSRQDCHALRLDITLGRDTEAGAIGRLLSLRAAVIADKGTYQRNEVRI